MVGIWYVNILLTNRFSNCTPVGLEATIVTPWYICHPPVLLKPRIPAVRGNWEKLKCVSICVLLFAFIPIDVRDVREAIYSGMEGLCLLEFCESFSY